MNKLGVEYTICAMHRSVDRTILAGKSIVLFRAAIKSPRTLDPYERRLCNFLHYAKMNCDQFVALAKKSPSKAENILIEYSIKDKERLYEKDHQRKLAACTIVNRLKPVKLLLDINDVEKIKWKKIKRFLPTPRRFAMDRAPTIEEIRKIYAVCDIRGRALLLLMLSSGIREGAVEGLLVRHLSTLERDGRIVAARLVVYQGEPEEYMTFLTPEAYHAIQEYLSYRRLAGETIGPESPLIRDKFEPETRRSRIAKTVDINRPEPFSPQAIRHYFNRLFLDYGFRKEKRKRHEFSIHGFRKWFKTMSEQAMKPINVELLMGHSVGLVLISNQAYALSEIDHRIKSGLFLNEVQFKPYSKEEILEILKERVSYGFRQGSISENLLSIVSGMSGGDARVGLQTLKIAAKDAESKDLETITIEDIKSAAKCARKYRLSYLLGKLNDHQRTIYEILRKCKTINSGELFEKYQKASKQTVVDRSYRNYMQKMEELGLVRESGSGRWKKFEIVC